MTRSFMLERCGQPYPARWSICKLSITIMEIRTVSITAVEQYEISSSHGRQTNQGDIKVIVADQAPWLGLCIHFFFSANLEPTIAWMSSRENKSQPSMRVSTGVALTPLYMPFHCTVYPFCHFCNHGGKTTKTNRNINPFRLQSAVTRAA
jgi:hypothetical protein